MMQSAIEILSGLQIELFLFLLAVCLHTVIFRHQKIFGLLGVTEVPKPSKLDIGENDKARSPRTVVSSQATAAGAQAAKRLETMLNARQSSQAIETFLSELIEEQNGECPLPALSGAVDTLGRQVNVELMSALRNVLAKQGVKTTESFRELMLRHYLRLRMMEDFQAGVAEFEATSTKLPPGVALLTLKAALRTGDLDEVLLRFRASSASFQERTLSAGPQSLLQQVARLAACKEEVEKLLAALFDSSFTKDAINAALVEFLPIMRKQGASVDILKMCETLCEQHQVPQSAALHAALIKAYGKVQDARRLFTQAVAAGSCAVEVLIAAVEVVGNNPETADALMADVLKQLPEKPPASLAVAVLKSPACVLAASRANGSGADVNAASLRLYEDHFSGIDIPDLDAMQMVVDAAVQNKHTQTLQTMLAVADKTRIISILKKYGMQHKLADARTVFEACKDKTTGLSNAFLEACVECCDAEAARATIEQASELGIADTVSYNTLLKAYLRANDFKGARATMSSMRSIGLPPNCVTYNELLDASFTSKSGGAWPVLEEMQAAGIQPNHVTCSILLKNVHSKSKPRDLERTMKVFDAIEDEVDEVLLSSLMEACIRAGRGDLLKPRLRKQRTAKKVQIRGAHAYGSLIRGFGYVHDLDGVWAMWREMKTRHIPLSSITLGCMVEALVSNGDPHAGLELIHEIQGDEKAKGVLNAVIYCSVLKGFSHQKKFESAWAVYEEMQQQKIDLSIATFNALVDACARSNEMGRVPQLLQDMQRAGIEPNLITYSAIVKGYCQENKLDKAFELLATMKQTTSLVPDEIMYNSLLDGCARQNLYDRGLALIQEMEKAGITPSNFTLSILVKLACRTRHVEEAFNMSRSISTKYGFNLNVHVYNNLIQGCIQARSLSRAFGVFEQMLGEGVAADVRSYKLLIQGYTAAGEWSTAIALLRTALSLPNPHPGLSCYGVTLLCPSERFPPAVLSEIASPIIQSSRNEASALSLLQDLKLYVPGFSMDPKVALRVASRAHRA
eukprot:CAMPEP_0178431500 /NCGR_PEP_ID=MMETSP0689_2-20121128/31882_1 /TAXON_ID=160604 /ORGANISM="Amphidinium massartii, Strain CS-259" /LENGTH=1023 /DNA_ID=CAMNT_0020053419 /DNA_START=147 /DNA_END=3218 /DNA_ORIENTATION=-